MNSILKDDLKSVRDYLTPPKRWTKGALFRDQKKDNVIRRDATCACLMGAMMIVAGGRGTLEGRERYDEMDAALAKQLPEGYCSLANFNDAEQTSHDAVLQLIGRALMS